MYNFYKQKLCTPSGYVAKFLLIMRLTTLILISAIMQVSASSFAQRITLSEKNTPLVAVFDKISSQSGYDFLVTSDLLQGAKLVNINVKNAELKDVLQKILEGQQLNFSIDNKIVVITKSEKTVIDKVVDYFFNIDLQGIVLNENGEPLAGANIMMMGTPYGYGTDETGRFWFNNITGRETLITSYLGYKTDTLRLRGQKNVVIRMVPESAKLEEVAIVNTGYQKLDKERVTGAVGKPDMKIFKSRTGSMDIMSRLDGLVAGVTVIAGPMGENGSSYGNGGTQRSVIRGKSSINLESDPLYVVDGIQVPNLSNINPNDVEDITVLKDAAAAAIYGAKAANGVIVIVTNNGRKGQKIRINYSGFLNFQGKPNFKNDYYLNTSQYIQAAREIFNPNAYDDYSLSYSFVAPHERLLYGINEHKDDPAYVSRANASLDSLSRIDNRQQVQDLFYRNAFTTNHTLSASGGSDKYSFSSSLSYTNDHSNIPGSSNSVYRISLNQSITPNKWLTIGLNTSLNNTISSSKNAITVGGGFLPYQLFEDSNGNPIQMNYTQGLSPEVRADYQLRSGINLDYTPLNEFDKAYSKNNVVNINTTANVEVKLWKGISFNGTYGYQKTPGTNVYYKDNSAYEMRRELLDFTKVENGVPVYYLPSTGGLYIEKNMNSQNWTVRNQVVYNTNLRHGLDRLNIQLGQEATESSNKLTTTTLRGYDKVLKNYALLDYVALSKPLFGAIGSSYSSLNEKPYDLREELTRFTSYFGLFNYGFDNKYFIDGSIRADKSSNFASTTSSQAKPVYSIGAKWLISKERFMEQVSWLNDFGLRATYGVTGNSPYTGAGALFDILYAGQNQQTGDYLSLSTIANSKLSWESTHTVNVGIDFAVLKSRLSGSIDVYHKNTTDLLGRVKYNPLTGYEAATGNIGNIINKGVELSLRSVNVQTANFNWSTNLIFSYNYNKLESYSIPEQYQLDAYGKLYSSYRVGYSNPAVFAYQYAGLDNMGDPQIKLADGTITKERDVAKAEDVVYMGTTIPKFNGGLSNTFRYKGLSLAANMTYSFGAVMRRTPNYFYTGRLTGNAGSFAGGSELAEFATRWKKPGDENITNVPSYVADQGENYTRRSTDYYTSGDINIISASYIKLRDLTLSYDISRSLSNALRVENVNLFMQTGNYLLWNANKYDIDPEYNGYTNGNKTYSIGLNVTF